MIEYETLENEGGFTGEELEDLRLNESDLEEMEIEVPYTPDVVEFDRVYDEIETGTPLTLSHVGRVFGAPFYELLIMCFLDSQDAARAIQNAINRLRAGEHVDEED